MECMLRQYCRVLTVAVCLDLGSMFAAISFVNLSYNPKFDEKQWLVSMVVKRNRWPAVWSPLRLRPWPRRNTGLKTLQSIQGLINLKYRQRLIHFTGAYYRELFMIICQREFQLQLVNKSYLYWLYRSRTPWHVPDIPENHCGFYDSNCCKETTIHWLESCKSDTHLRDNVLSYRKRIVGRPICFCDTELSLGAEKEH